MCSTIFNIKYIHKSSLHSLFFCIKLGYLPIVRHNRLKDQFEDVLVDARILEEPLILEIELLVANKLDKGVGDSPRMRLLDNQTFHDDSS